MSIVTPVAFCSMRASSTGSDTTPTVPVVKRRAFFTSSKDFSGEAARTAMMHGDIAIAATGVKSL